MPARATQTPGPQSRTPALASGCNPAARNRPRRSRPRALGRRSGATARRDRRAGRETPSAETATRVAARKRAPGIPGWQPVGASARRRLPLEGHALRHAAATKLSVADFACAEPASQPGRGGRLVARTRPPADSEQVPLREALGRTLAVDVKSTDDVPGFDNSAMDGFAVRASDTAGARETSPIALRISGESRAGQPAPASLLRRRGDPHLDRRGARPRRRRGRADRGLPRAGRQRSRSWRRSRPARRCGAPETTSAPASSARARTGVGPAEAGVLASVGAAAVDCPGGRG